MTGKGSTTVSPIDPGLARHSRFTDEELNFIITYDIKCRMGRVGAEEDA